MSTPPTAPIGELCTLVNGRAFKPSDWSDQGVPIVRIQNLNDERKPLNLYNGEVKRRFLVDSGDILLSWSGTPGTSFGCFVWDRGRAVLNQHIFRVEVDETRIDREFFVHAVNSRLEEMIALAHGGVGLRHITKGKLEGIQLPVPPRGEQRRIVASIQEGLGRIRELNRLRAESAAESDALLGVLIEELLARGASSCDSVALADVCSIEGTLVDPRRAEFRDLLHVGGANIETGTGVLLSLRTTSEEKLKSGKFIFCDRDVLYNKIRPYLRKAARADFRGLCSADMYPLRPREDLMDRDYLFYLLLSRSFTDYAITVSNRAGMPKVNRADLFAYKCALPSLKDQRAVAARLDEARAACLSVKNDLQDHALEGQVIAQAVLRRAFSRET